MIVFLLHDQGTTNNILIFINHSIIFTKEVSDNELPFVYILINPFVVFRGCKLGTMPKYGIKEMQIKHGWIFTLSLHTLADISFFHPVNQIKHTTLFRIRFFIQSLPWGKSELESRFIVRSQLGLHIYSGPSRFVGLYVITQSIHLITDCYPNWYWIHTIPKFCFQSSWITSNATTLEKWKSDRPSTLFKVSR